MKSNLAYVLTIFTLVIALPAAAQMAPPQPLQDDLYEWMAGEWEGTTESPMGKAADEMKVDWDLDHQFLNFHYKSKIGEGSTAMTYKGQGMMTVNPQTQEYVGYWFGSFRDISVGKGTRTGNKITMTWDGPTGSETRTMEKVAEDKWVMAFKGKGPDGSETTGATTLTRKMKKEKGAKKS